MSSSYPPPPPSTTTADGAAPTPDSAQQNPDTDTHATHATNGANGTPTAHDSHNSHDSHDAHDAQSYQHSHSHSEFIADAAAAAVAAAHHGLQALQAAVAAPASVPAPNPVAPVTPVTPATSVASHHAPLPSSNTPVAPPAPAPAPPQSTKPTRLRRACDMCSQRKVKCDDTQPCRPCHELGVDCTFNRTMKRRGPPNKHAEAARAAKQQRLEANLSPGPHNAAETLISIAGGQEAHPSFDAEAIAPWPVLTLLIDDFFTYIHPLVPFPHEPTFRMSFTAREDRTNKGFLALLASMIGALVASFPRTARLHLKSQQQSMHLYPKAITMIERCRTIALQSRGPAFYAREEVTVYDAATSYFLCLAAGYTLQWKVCRRFMAETLTLIRELGYHKPRDMGSSVFGVTYRGPSFNHVEDQLGKRIFWCTFLGIRSMYQLGSHHNEIILPPPTPSEPYPELPVEVDDQYILTHQILGQPEGTVSLLTGFNQAVKIYMTMNGLVSVELSYGITTLPFRDQRSMLDESLQAVKQVMDGLPRELTIDLDANLVTAQSPPPHGLPDLLPQSAPTSVFDDGASAFHYCPLPYTTVPTHPDYRPPVPSHPERRRLLQYEIQKANIYTSQLATRSYYVERYFSLRDAHREHVRVQEQQGQQQQQQNGTDGTAPVEPSPSKSTANAEGEHQKQQQQQQQHDSNDAVDAAMSAERELIVAHLLTVLSSLSQRSMEPNAAPLISKVRQVASTLVNSSNNATSPNTTNGGSAGNRSGNESGDAVERKAAQAQEALGRLVEVLMRLERISPGGGGGHANGVGDGAGESAGMVMDDEEQELRNWADMRDQQQVRFFQGGGLVGLL